MEADKFHTAILTLSSPTSTENNAIADRFKCTPKCLLDFTVPPLFFQTIGKIDQPIYLILSEKYRDLNLRNSASETREKYDSFILMAVMLCRTIIERGVENVAFVFDGRSSLDSFQRLATSCELIGAAERTSACCFSSSGKVFQPGRVGRAAPKTYQSFKGSRHFPDKSIRVSLALVNEDEITKCKDRLIVYVKTNKQYYGSFYPRFFGNEDKIRRWLGHERFVVMMPGIDGFPKIIRETGYAIFKIGDFMVPDLKYSTYGKHPLSSKITECGKWLRETYSEISAFHKRDFSIAVLAAMSYRDDDDSCYWEPDIQKISDIVTVREEFRMTCEQLNLAAKCQRMIDPVIKDWKDLYDLRNSAGARITISQELETEMKRLFGLIFSDISYLHKYMEISGSVSTPEQISKLCQVAAKAVVERNDWQITKEELDRDDADFDPGESVAYLESAYKVEGGQKFADANYYILEKEGKRYIYYCQFGGSARLRIQESHDKVDLANLKAGDTIVKDYWDYPTLVSRLTEYAENGEGNEDIIENIEFNKECRTSMHHYSNRILNASIESDYGEFSYSTSAIRGKMRAWANSTMCPRFKTSYKLFCKVIERLNGYYGLNYDPIQTYNKFRDLRKKRLMLKDGKERKKVYFVVKDGPFPMRIEVDKLGKIFRLS